MRNDQEPTLRRPVITPTPVEPVERETVVDAHYVSREELLALDANAIRARTDPRWVARQAERQTERVQPDALAKHLAEARRHLADIERIYTAKGGGR